MKHVVRYHPLLVTLHWVLALLIVAALLAGFVILAPMSNTNPEKLDVLRLHMAGGMLILGLMLIRLIVRWLSATPTAATVGRPSPHPLARISHFGLYVLVLIMAATGFATALVAGLPAIVFGASGAPLPASFTAYPTRLAHGYAALALTGFIGLHVLAVLYHQFVVKDALLRRMLFGPRSLERHAGRPD